jgi:hypothetical protein
MQEEYEIENSRLCQKVSRDGMTVEVLIYRGKEDPGWLLEVVDQEDGSTVWDDLFPTEEEALAEALNTIETEGIACFLRDSSDSLH